ncbi:MAG TPA: hypothetical protein VNX65_00090 [Patescibacteria group bacterium]|nr:hypothetical protein [Patescibacteria group bacterium]
MYSGTTIRHTSGNLLGAHQKIDRVARKALERSLPNSAFPTIKQILYFEGVNGPDGLKRKSPAKDEPWHYYDPTDPGDVSLIDMMDNHTVNLTKALKDKNHERAAFESAWLAHAVVDGLTPAHHFPLEAALNELRGEGLETRTSLKDKLIIRQVGDTKRQTLAKNWRYWGAKGIMTTHGLYEWGVAATIAPLVLKKGYPNGNELIRVRDEGITPLFREAAAHIYSLNMYEAFYKSGWTRKLVRQTRAELAPLLVKIVALAWYAAAYKAYGNKSK